MPCWAIALVLASVPPMLLDARGRLANGVTLPRLLVVDACRRRRCAGNATPPPQLAGRAPHAGSE